MWSSASDAKFVQSRSEIYFKQIRSFDLLTQDDEVTLAKRLEESETALWRLLLEAPEAPIVIAHVRNVFAARMKASEEHVALPDLAGAVETIATSLRNLDHARVYSTAVLDTVPLSATIKEQARTFLREAAVVRERFIKSNLRLVIAWAKKWIPSGVPLADLIQEGNLGLMHAVQRYDHRKGFRFSTYATWWIRQALGRFVQDKSRAVRVPVHLQDTHSKVNKQRAALTAALGREPTLGELSEATGMPTQKLEELAIARGALSAAASLDSVYVGVDGDSPTLLDSLVDPGPSIPEDLIAEESRHRVIAALATLPEREAAILMKRFGITNREGVEMSLREIGDEYGLSRERIRQLEQDGLTNLRRTLAAPLRLSTKANRR